MILAPPQSSARRLLWALVVLCGAVFAALAPRLLYPDLNLDYPFVDGDSHDWIANGLFFTGADVRYSGRAPLLPLALAALARLGLLNAWPLLCLLLFLATVVGFYTLAAKLFPATAAFAAALLVLLDYSLQGLTLDVMADLPASCLLLWSLRAFLTAAGPPAAAARPRRYAWSGLLAGLAGLTQMIGLVVPLAGGITLLARRRRDLACRWPWIGALLALACEGAWLLARRLAFAARGDSLESKGVLVGFHLSSLRFYLWSLLSLLGLPACLLLAAGVALAAVRACRREPSTADHPATDRPAFDGAASDHPAFDGAAALMTLLVLAGTLGFFVFLWRYDAKRFLVFAAWPAALLVAAALAPLARAQRPGGRISFAAIALLAVAGAAMPLPEPAHDPTWAALWPLPPLAGHLAVGSGLVAGASVESAGGAAATARDETLPALTVSRPPLLRLAEWSVWSRVARAWAERPRLVIHADPSLFATARAALYLYGQIDDGGGRYRTITRLSAALRKPVRFVPLAALARYWSLIRLGPAVPLSADYLVRPAEIQGLAGSWLLVTPADRTLPPPQPATTAPPPPLSPLAPEDPRRAAVQARAVATSTGRANAYVALFWRPRAGGMVQLFLPFLLQTTDLYVVEPAEWPATLALFAHAPIESERRFAGARVVETRLRGLRTALITTAPVPPLPPPGAAVAQPLIRRILR